MRYSLLTFLLAAVAAAQPATAPSTPKPAPAGSKPAKPAAVPAYKQLKFPPLKQVKIPDVPTFTLSNGIKVFLLENHELPLVSGFALVRTGNLFDPPDKVGLASATGAVMRTGGTAGKTGEQIDEELESVAASVESSIGETSGTVGFNALKENTDQVLAIFKDVLTQPAFRQDKLDLFKTQARGGISRRNDDASSIAGREIADLVYGKDNPYGWSMEYEHLDNIKRDDLVGFYKRYFFPANIRIAVYGDFSTPEMKAKLEKLLGDWTYTQPAVPAFPPVSKKPNPGIFLAKKDDVTQTFFQLGHFGGMLKDSDYPALEVMNDILGGGFSSRMFRRIRTQQGLVYSIGSVWGANYNHPGLFRVGGSTKSASTVDAIEAAKEEVAKMRDSEVTDQELSTSKQSVLNGFVFNFDSPAKTLNRIVTYEYQGYPPDFIFQYQKAIEAVSKADVLRVAKDYLKPAEFTIVAVGKPADFGKPLTTLGAVKEIDLTIPEPKREAVKTDSASIAKGKQIFERMQNAIGGADKIAAVTDSTMTAEVEIQTPQGAIKVPQTTMWFRPAYFRQSQQLPFGQIVTFFDGTTGWMITPQGKQPMPPPVIKQAQDQVFRNFNTLMLSDRDPNRTINAVADNVIEISDKEGHSVRIHADPATGLPSKLEYRGAGQTTTDSYSDWKEGPTGLKHPHRIVITQGERKFADVTIKEIKVNTGLKPEDLSKEQ